MTIERIKNEYIIDKLNEKSDLDTFSCGLEDMDEFLKNDALNQQNENLSVTYLVRYDDEIFGFFSLISDKIELKDIEDEYDLPFSVCPAMKIGRFSVTKNIVLQD